ncbi:MAG: HAMP domain-containing protein [Gammaproteobacteria bacterium]
MRHLRYLSIRAKIVLLPAIMLCALIAYCLFTVVQSRLSIAALDRFGSEQLPVVSEVNLASLGLVEVHALFTAAVGDRSEFLLDDALRHAALTRSRIEQMSGGAVANTRIGELLELWDRFVERSGAAVQHVITGDADLRTLHLLATDKQQAYDAVREAFVALRADTEAGFAAALNHAARRTNQSLELGIAIVAALCALTVLMAMLVHASIGEPIERLKTAVGEVARGNFGGRAEVEGSDAIAEMCAAFNALLADLQAAVGETNRVLAALAQGNFRPRIAADLPGELGRLKDGVNT